MILTLRVCLTIQHSKNFDRLSYLSIGRTSIIDIQFCEQSPKIWNYLSHLNLIFIDCIEVLLGFNWRRRGLSFLRDVIGRSRGVGGVTLLG